MVPIAAQVHDFPRFDRGDWEAPMKVSDATVLAETLQLGKLAEPLGFDTIWSTEHFGTTYTMTPDALQNLAYWAGHTERIDVGSAVVVLPWHHPIQLAHKITNLDHLLEGRRYFLGIGRGVAKMEYDALGIDRNESRGRFKESWDVLKLALTQERLSYDGEFFKIPETSIRPRPLHDDMLDHTACAFTTPESMELAANEGFSQFFVTGAPLEEMSVAVDQYNAIRARRGLDADQPRVLMWMYCSNDERQIDRAGEWFAVHGAEASSHYGFTRPGEFDGVKGYEGYAAAVEKGLKEEAEGTRAQGNAMVRPESQPIGTPEEIIRRLRLLQEQTGAREVAVIPHFGGMTVKEAEDSVRLFAQEVMPAIQADPAPARVRDSVSA
ncbi:MAG: LLM class flavin-dependent oxidoreductase [Pirellulales bacterium]